MSNRRSIYPVRNARSAGGSPTADRGSRFFPSSTPQRHTYFGQAPLNTALARLYTFFPPSPSPLLSAVGTQRPILFYGKDEPYFSFTNFSPHPVEYGGKVYPTSEHLFQALKFLHHRPDLAEHIRTYSARPAVALKEARRFQPEVRRDWMSVNKKMMDEVLKRKFTQHPDLKAELLSTGNAELIENSPIDPFWGNGPDGQGRNELGKALMRLRESLRRRSFPTPPDLD